MPEDVPDKLPGVRRRADPRPRRARHLVLARRCGRSRRSAGPTRRPSSASFYPTDVNSTARDIIFLWVARMVMMGVEFTDAAAVHRRQHPLGHPGARRPPDVEVARHRHRPARRDRGARRRRRPLRPAGDVVVAGRALLGREGQAGPRPGQQAVERVAADPDARRRRARRAAPARPSRTAGSSRGSSARRSRSPTRSTASTSRARRSTCTTSSGARSATGTSSSSSRACTTRTPTRRRCRRRCCTCSSAA